MPRSNSLLQQVLDLLSCSRRKETLAGSSEPTNIDSDVFPPSPSRPRVERQGGNAGQTWRGIEIENKTIGNVRRNGDRKEIEAKRGVPKEKENNLSERCRNIAASSEDIPPSLGEVLKSRQQREQSALSLAAIMRAAYQSNQEKEASAINKPPQQPSQKTAYEENTMRSTLLKLGEIDARRIFMVRKIEKLGFTSPEKLKTHFSQFGLVENVFVTHNIRAIESEEVVAKPAARPAGVGFVVMETPDDVIKVLQHGLEQQIAGATISLTGYEHYDPDDVMRNECKFGVEPSIGNAMAPQRPRFPTYTNMTEDNTMRANLRKMADIDENRIIMLRRINKLGLGSAKLLTTHFEQFGSVSNVYVTHNIDRRKVDPDNPHSRPTVRPGGIGFLVMETPEGAAAAFQHGVDHAVFGVAVQLLKYTHQRLNPDESTQDAGNELEIQTTENAD